MTEKIENDVWKRKCRIREKRIGQDRTEYGMETYSKGQERKARYREGNEGEVGRMEEGCGGRGARKRKGKEGGREEEGGRE